MSATLPILVSIKDRLFEQIDRFAVELFPDDLENYYLKDENGAILVQYAGSKFESLDSIDIIQQRRSVHIACQVAIITPEVFAKLIGIETVKIGEAVYEENGELNDIWSNAVVLAYVAGRSTQGKGTVYEPSYGYTVRRQKGLFVDTYPENGGKIEVIRTTDIHKPHLVGSSAGYLISNCI